jgi:hypothetical protein
VVVLLDPRVARAQLRVPDCETFVDIGRRWVGIDEERAAQVLGVPLHDLSNDDIDQIRDALRRCLAAATVKDDKLLLQQDLKQIPALRAARDQVRRAFLDFEKAKKEAKPRLERIAATLDASPANAENRSALSEAEANVSAIFFELEQKRLRAQASAPLIDSYPPYRDAMAALARKEDAYGEEARKQLIAHAQEAFERRRGQFDQLNLPADAQDATIILEGIGVNGAKSVRWLTLRQWASLVLDNLASSGAAIVPSSPGSDFTIEVLRPGYGPAEFGFHRDGRDLLLVRVGRDGQLSDIKTLEDRRGANRLLLEVVRSR